jgi:hypothetical protein
MAAKIIKAQTEERPYFFDFKKYEVVGPHPTMDNLTYDPFPNAKMDDVVRSEILGRELMLYATLEFDDKIEATEIRPGMAVNYGENQFAVTSSEIRFTESGATVEMEGSKFLSEIDPVKVLARWRKALAARTPK